MILNPIYMRYQKTLPAVFDDSLTYYEAVAKLQAKINECVEAINSFEDDYKKYTDEQIAKALADIDSKIGAVYDYVNQQVNELNFKISDNFNILNGKIDSTKAELKNEIAQFYLVFANFRTEIQEWVKNQNNLLDIKFTGEIAALKKYVDDAVIGTIYVYNIFRGAKTTVDIYLEDMYNYLRAGALTAGEYDALKITAGRYDSLYLKAYQYDVAGRWYFDEEKVFSPVTGEYVAVQVALQELASLHQDALTANEYDALLLTAQIYDDKAITAYTYDFDGQNAVA